MMMRRLSCVMLAAVVLGALAGCQATRSPRAEVRSVAVTEQSAAGARVEVMVEVENPNDVALPVRWATYDVRVAGLEAFMLTDQPAVTLPPRGRQTVTLAAAFERGDDQPLAGRSVRVSGRLRYQPPGEIRQLMTDYGIPLPGVAFSEVAELDAFGDDE